MYTVAIAMTSMVQSETGVYIILHVAATYSVEWNGLYIRNCVAV